MVDQRFYNFSGPVAFRDLLRDCGLETEGATDAPVTGAADLASAVSGDIVLASSRRYVEGLRVTRASFAIINGALSGDVPEGVIAVVARDPHERFAAVLQRLYPQSTAGVLKGLTSPQDHPRVEAEVLIGANVATGGGVEIGRGTVIGPNCSIGRGVTIGRNCLIGPGVSIECAHVGDNVVMHAGARIGTEGFGWLDLGRSNIKIPQLGRVIIQDRVEIGANTTIDRGALGDTVIGEGTKIDNLVQIGHNCVVGRNCLIAAMSGLSGSTIVGDGVLMGGGVGTSGHLTIGSGSVIHGRAAVTKDWEPGSKLAGAPAQDIKGFWRELAQLRRLAKRGEGE